MKHQQFESNTMAKALHAAEGMRCRQASKSASKSDQPSLVLGLGCENPEDMNESGQHALLHPGKIGRLCHASMA